MTAGKEKKVPGNPTGTIELVQTSPIQFDDEVQLALTWSKLKGNQSPLVEMVCTVDGEQKTGESAIGGGTDSPLTLTLGGYMKPWIDLADPTVDHPASCVAKLYVVSGGTRTLLDETDPFEVE